MQRKLLLLALSAFALAGANQAFAAGQDDPVVDHSRTSSRLEALPRLPVSQRKVVTIYEFRSGVQGVSNTALTDMFTTALMKSGAFLVAERQRLTPDIAAEKTLNAKGMSTGDTAQKKLRAAQYIFEGAVSEANQNENSNEGGFSLGGMDVNGNKSKGSIAIDVRVVDADSGLVLDSVDVTKSIESRGSSVSGIGNLAGSIAALGGHSIPLSPDVHASSSHHEGVDRAVRACIEAAVLELVQRYGRSSG